MQVTGGFDMPVLAAVQCMFVSLHLDTQAPDVHCLLSGSIYNDFAVGIHQGVNHWEATLGATLALAHTGQLSNMLTIIVAVVMWTYIVQ